MLLGAELSPDAISALQAVAIAVIGGIVAVRIRKLDTEQRRAARLAREEKQRCDGLELRVKELEEQLQRCVKARRRK